MKKTIFNFIGFDPDNVFSLGKYHGNRLYHLCLSVPFTGLVSSGLIAITLFTLFLGLSYTTILAIAVLWFLLITFIDRAIVVAKNAQSKTLQYIRIFIITGFVIIHSGAIDLEFFKGDIETKITQDFQAKKDEVEEKYMPLYDDLASRKQDLYNDNDLLSEKITEGRRNIYEEIHDGAGTTRGSGKGEIALEKELLFNEDKAEHEKNIALNNDRIKQLNTQVVDLDTKKRAEIALLPTYDKTGVVTRLSALHEVVFVTKDNEPSKFPLKLYYFAFLIVAITLEALPLIAKITYRDSIDAYFKNADKENKLNSDKVNHNIQVKRNDLLLDEYKEQVRFNFESEKVINSLNFRTKVANQEAKMEGEIDYAKSVEKHLDELIALDNDAKNKYSKEYYKSYRAKVIKPAFDAFLDKDEPMAKASANNDIADDNLV